ncbi:MAG: hypothetical protein WKF90_02155 [Pyrinomonadaceae bacterium]
MASSVSSGAASSVTVTVSETIPETLTVEPKLIVRQSTAPVKK